MKFKRYRVRIRDIANFVGCESKNIYAQMLQVTKRLMERVLKIENMETGKVELFHWVSYASYER